MTPILFILHFQLIVLILILISAQGYSDSCGNQRIPCYKLQRCAFLARNQHLLLLNTNHLHFLQRLACEQFGIDAEMNLGLCCVTSSLDDNSYKDDDYPDTTTQTTTEATTTTLKPLPSSGRKKPSAYSKPRTTTAATTVNTDTDMDIDDTTIMTTTTKPKKNHPSNPTTMPDDDDPFSVPDTLNKYDKKKNSDTPQDEENALFNLLPHVRMCGYAPASSGKPAGGDEAGLGAYPWMALIGYRGKPISYTTVGTLISDTFVLTAAHNLVNLPRGMERPIIRVNLGDYDLSTKNDCDSNGICAPENQEIPIEEVIPHEDYNPETGENDIGLIKMSKPANQNGAYLIPICLPVNKSEVDEIQKNTSSMVVAGWGPNLLNHPETSKKSPAVLRDAIMSIVPNEKCRLYFGNRKTLRPGLFCAKMKVGGAKFCLLDSGSPMTQTIKALRWTKQDRTFQYGIATRMRPQSNKCSKIQDQYAVFTNVAYYSKWILSHLKNT